MEVYIVRIMELRVHRSGDEISIHSTAQSADQALFDFVVARWDEDMFGKTEDYAMEEVIRKFFHDFKKVYRYDIQTQELVGVSEENDPSIVELTPDELRVTRYALGDARYDNVSNGLGMNQVRVMNLTRSARIKLED